jgi:hypothetical protein
MSDAQAFRGQDAKPAGGLVEQASAVGARAKDTAAALAEATVGAVKNQAADAAAVASRLASQAGDRLNEEADERKNEMADYVGRVAGAIRRAAGDFESELPMAASYMRSAAGQVESVSTSMRNGNAKDLVASAQSFARAQPTAFLGLTALVGFGVVRFLKSSGSSTSERASTQAYGAGE